MPIHNEYIYEWSDLARLVQEFHKSNWIFRGVLDAEYGLVPRIARQASRTDDRTGRVLTFDEYQESVLLEQFQRESLPFLRSPPQNEMEWLALGQFHGLPTRLLDWSESLLVAAYFAVEEPMGEETAIYGVEAPREAEPGRAPFSYQQTDRPVLVRTPHFSQRITSQQTVLTLHPDPTQTWDMDGIVRWHIPKDRAFTLKGILNFCGIHRAALFPDVPDAVTGHLQWLYKWSRLT